MPIHPITHHKLLDKRLSADNLGLVRREVEGLLPEAQYGHIARVFNELDVNAPATLQEFEATLDRLGYRDQGELLNERLAAAFEQDPDLEEAVFEGDKSGLTDVFPADEELEKLDIRKLLQDAFQETLVLQEEGELGRDVIRCLRLYRFSPDNEEKFKVRYEDTAGTRDDVKRAVADQKTGKGAYSRRMADMILWADEQDFSRAGTKREVFHECDVANWYLKFLESVAADNGVAGKFEIALSETYDKKEFLYLEQPLQMVDYIYQKFLKSLGKANQEHVRQDIETHLAGAAEAAGVALPVFLRMGRG